MKMPVKTRLELAYRALKLYELQPVMVTFIQHSENMTFRVETRDGDYLLRAHIPATKSFGDDGADPNMVKSEMLWLEALHNRRLPVPPPVKGVSGDYVARVDGTNVTLLQWQPGELLTREMESDETAAQMGELVGQLHAYSSKWKLPPRFSRPRRDMAYFQNALTTLWPAVDDGRISYQDYKALQTSLEELNVIAGYTNRSRKNEGLLHGDLHRGNFLLDSGKIRLIDFSMCAFGSYAFDLGTCLSNVRTAFHPEFLEHYTRMFSLPTYYERLIEGYFLASYIMTFSLWISDPDSQETLIQRVPYITREYATRFNRDERFWFT